MKSIQPDLVIEKDTEPIILIGEVILTDAGGNELESVPRACDLEDLITIFDEGFIM